MWHKSSGKTTSLYSIHVWSQLTVYSVWYFFTSRFCTLLILAYPFDNEEFPKLLKNLPLHLSGTPTLCPEHERIVLETMSRILYNEMGFQGNKDRYYDENNSFIEKVCLTSQIIFFTCDLWSIFFVKFAQWPICVAIILFCEHFLYGFKKSLAIRVLMKFELFIHVSQVKIHFASIEICLSLINVCFYAWTCSWSKSTHKMI